LLKNSEDKIICIVESEKTAIIASVYFPEYVWIASGGANGLTSDKIIVLKNRKIILVPDLDEAGRDKFLKKVDDLKKIGCKVSIMDLLPEEKTGLDIADFLIRNKSPSKINELDVKQGIKFLNQCHFDKCYSVTDEKMKNIFKLIIRKGIFIAEFNADYSKIRKILWF